jgi:hypothetical protein
LDTDVVSVAEFAIFRFANMKLEKSVNARSSKAEKQEKKFGDNLRRPL